MNRRDLIRGIGAVICAGAVPTFVPRLLEPQTLQEAYSAGGPIGFTATASGFYLVAADYMGSDPIIWIEGDIIHQ